MDIKGKDPAPSRANPLRLEAPNSLKPDWAAGVIDRMTAAADEFKTLAKNYPILPSTRQTISAAIEKSACAWREHFTHPFKNLHPSPSGLNYSLLSHTEAAPP